MSSPKVTAPRDWSGTEQKVSLVAFAGVGLLVGYFLLGEGSSLIDSRDDQIVGHVCAGGALTIAATGMALAYTRRRPRLLYILIAGATIVTLLEFAQGLVPIRTIEMSDLAAGLGGVLLASIAIELVLMSFSRLVAMRIHAATAWVTTAVLLTMAVLGLMPNSISGSAPDGDECPLTEFEADGARFDIGESPTIRNNCLITSSGGLGLIAPDSAQEVGDESMLISSTLRELGDDIQASELLVVRAQVVTPDFDSLERVPPGVLLILESEELGSLLQIRTRNDRVEVFLYGEEDSLPTLSFVSGLSSGGEHVVEVHIEGELLTIHVDGSQVSSSSTPSGWFDSIPTEDLRLIIGNNRVRSLPFSGIIDWVEVTSKP